MRPEEALELPEAQLDLLLTDVVMPLAARLQNLIVAQAGEELRRRRWRQSAPWVAAAVLLLALALAIKLRGWR